MLAGTVSSISMWVLVKTNPKMLAYIALSPNAKDMAENMYRALWSWLICVSVTVIVSLLTRPKPVEELTGLVYGCTELPSEGHSAALEAADLLGRGLGCGIPGSAMDFLVVAGFAGSAWRDPSLATPLGRESNG